MHTNQHIKVRISKISQKLIQSLFSTLALEFVYFYLLTLHVVVLTMKVKSI